MRLPRGGIESLWRRRRFRYNQGNLDKKEMSSNIVTPRRLIAIYPGSFDPITNGHLDLIERCSRLVDHLIVGLLGNEQKQPLFSVEERLEMLHEVVRSFANVEVDSFDGLLVDFAAKRQATLILRGIRAISDYEYELQMALMNRRLGPGYRNHVSDVQ